MATATERRAQAGLVVGNGIAGNIKVLPATYNLDVTTAAGATIDFGYIPSNARILGASRVYNDDLATTGSPTLDIGLAAVDSNITTDDDALNDGIALSSAGSDALLVKDHANLGKRAWEFVNGQTTDPGGSFLVQGTLKDAATTTAGDITIELYYTID